jgi:hypothetical protein
MSPARPQARFPPQPSGSCEQSHDPVPQMKGYLINVARNRNGVGFGQWLHIDRWSDKVLDYIVRYEAANA